MGQIEPFGIKPHFDHELWYRAETLTTGANVHRVKNAMLLYRLAWDLAKPADAGNQFRDIEKAEMALRALLYESVSCRPARRKRTYNYDASC